MTAIASGIGSLLDFQALDEFLRTSGADGAHPQRRAESRRPVSAPVLLGVLLGDDGRFKPLQRAWVTDLAHEGIGLLTEHQSPTHAMLAVDLTQLVRRGCVIPLRVVYCQRILPQTWRLGGAFIRGT